MKKMSWGCIIIGMISIVLATLNAITVFSPSDIFHYFIKNILPLSGLSEFIEIVTHFRGLEFLAQCVSEIFLKSNIFKNNVILSIIGYIISIILAISGIGTIWAKPWGRKCGYIYSIIIIIIAIISIPIFLIYFLHFPFGDILGATKLDVKIIAVESYIILLFFFVLYPLMLLFFFSQPKIKEEFDAKNKVANNNEDVSPK